MTDDFFQPTMSKINLSTIDLIAMAVYILCIVFWGLRNSSRKSAEGNFFGGGRRAAEAAPKP